jgi:hypothetical protein
MKQFASIEKLDRSILYTLELASSISVLLLAFGLIASMANVLTKGAVLTDHLWMQQVWAWTQCIAIDASVAGTIIRTFRFYHEGEQVKTWLYGLLSVLLLFTAAIVSNIEAVQQTLNITLNNAYLHVFVPVEALIWIRSIAIVLLIVAHAMRHVQIAKPLGETAVAPAQVKEQQPPFVLTPEMVRQLRELLMQTTVAEAVHQEALPEPQNEQSGEHMHIFTLVDKAQQHVDNYERVKSYLADHPKATLHEIAGALTISVTTANKWRGKLRAESNQGRRKKARSS